MSIQNTDRRVDLTGFPVNDSPTPVNWRGKVFHVWPLIERAMVSDTISEIISLCYNDRDGVMIPENADYAYRCCMINNYTDLTLPSDDDELYRLIYATDIYDTVMKHVNRAQADIIRKVVDTTVFGYRE